MPEISDVVQSKSTYVKEWLEFKFTRIQTSIRSLTPCDWNIFFRDTCLCPHKIRKWFSFLCNFDKWCYEVFLITCQHNKTTASDEVGYFDILEIRHHTMSFFSRFFSHLTADEVHGMINECGILGKYVLYLCKKF